MIFLHRNIWRASQSDILFILVILKATFKKIHWTIRGGKLVANLFCLFVCLFAGTFFMSNQQQRIDIIFCTEIYAYQIRDNKYGTNKICSLEKSQVRRTLNRRACMNNMMRVNEAKHNVDNRSI